MASVIQSRAFHQTFQGVFIGGLDTSIDSLWSQANQFMASLPAKDILDVHSSMSPVGTNGSNFYYQIIVTYRQE